MTCTAVHANNMVESYVLGHLNESEQDAFEQHYFTCPECFESVRTMQSIQAEMARDPGFRNVAATLPSRKRFPLMAAAAAILVALGGASGIWYLAKPKPALVTQVAPPPAPKRSAIAELARVDAPPYTAPALRGVAGGAGEQFRIGMRSYQRRDYNAAETALQRAADLGPSNPQAWFFRGICDLMLSRAGAAIPLFQRVLALGDSPYIEGAHFYLAKAFLAQGDLPAASDELRKTIQLSGDREAEARAVLAQLNALMGNR
jgi:tetratricopeptide (TPR) repeat protein